MELKERLDSLKNRIQSDAFYTQQSLGGELNFHIFDYDPEDELLIRDFISNLLRSYSHANSKILPIEFDLFKLILEILSEKIGSSDFLHQSFTIEEEEGAEELLEILSGVLSPEAFTQLIKQRAEGHNLVLLTGIGKAYPLIRSHTILNNLHPVLDQIPVILFYPGRYDQRDLRLFKGSAFEGLRDDHYYRAFKLVGN